MFLPPASSNSSQFPKPSFLFCVSLSLHVPFWLPAMTLHFCTISFFLQPQCSVTSRPPKPSLTTQRPILGPSCSICPGHSASTCLLESLHCVAFVDLPISQPGLSSEYVPLYGTCCGLSKSLTYFYLSLVLHISNYL